MGITMGKTIFLVRCSLDFPLNALVENSLAILMGNFLSYRLDILSGVSKVLRAKKNTTLACRALLIRSVSLHLHQLARDGALELWSE